MLWPLFPLPCPVIISPLQCSGFPIVLARLTDPASTLGHPPVPEAWRIHLPWREDLGRVRWVAESRVQSVLIVSYQDLDSGLWSSLPDLYIHRHLVGRREREVFGKEKSVNGECWCLENNCLARSGLLRFLCPSRFNTCLLSTNHSSELLYIFTIIVYYVVYG